MSYGTDTGRVWDDLRRRENELKWNGHQPGFGQSYHSMGRPADVSRHYNGGWALEQMGRVDRVRRALEESGPRAQRLIAQRLSGIDLSTISSILVSACQDIALLYGGSAVAGGFIGGIGGAFFGGVGAIPGAAAGAAAGSYVGGWVLGLLGLKSLVEGVARAIPEALQYYERGFCEAWGPARQDHLHGGAPCTTCSPGFAASDLAQGHVIMVSALLTVLVAYLTRGKGDKEALLQEISRSPRLGPKVAKWVEQNEGRLRKHPALQSRGSGGSGPFGTPHAQPPQLKRGRASAKEKEQAPSRPLGMPQKTVPCFKTKGLPQGDVPEFDRQLAGQEAGINNMSVAEYLDGRDAFDNKRSVRNPRFSHNARAAYGELLFDSLSNQLQKQGLSAKAADKLAAELAAEKMKTLAALHNPDMVVGGRDAISDFGDRKINSRIGAQWNKGGRLQGLDKAADAIPKALRGSTKMNAKLERCR